MRAKRRVYPCSQLGAIVSVRSVLIIDDDAVFQEIVWDHFAQQGVTDIVSAVNGKQAKQILQRMI